MENNIPSGAKKVFSGIRTNIYQWDQEMYDGSIKIFERAQFINGAFVVAILPNGRILLTRQEQPARKSHFIWLPGWAFDSPFEDPINYPLATSSYFILCSYSCREISNTKREISYWVRFLRAQ